MKTNKRYKKLILLLCISVIIILSVLAAYALTDISWRCPFNLITGILLHNGGLLCPGCGSTRAVIHYLKLDFKGGFMLNMMFPLEMAYILFVLIVSSVSYIKGGKFTYRSPCKQMDVSVLIIVIAWWIIRNIFNI